MLWFNSIGMIFVIIMLVPNVLQTIFHKENFNNLKRYKAMEFIEQIGRYGTILFMIFNIPYTYFDFWFDTARIIYILVDSILIGLYVLGWILFWNSHFKIRAYILSILPTMIFLFSGIYLLNIPLILSSILFGVGHITLSILNSQNLSFNFSKRFTAKIMTEEHIDEMLSLCKDNTTYYKYCPPFVTKESLSEDLKKLPPNKKMKDKYYIGIYEDQALLGLADIILKYPNPQTVFIGFFMMNLFYQSKGIGSQIIQELCDYFSEHDFQKVRLAYVKGNVQSESFWLKNHFMPVGLEIEQENYSIVVLERNIMKD